MCRHYLSLSQRPADCHAPLISDDHALIAQCVRDSRGEEHRDGWGLAVWNGQTWYLQKSTQPACDDPEFQAAAGMRGQVVLAHLRAASVGSVQTENSHPFRWRDIVFCHNGTVVGWDALGPQLIEETRADLHALQLGSTDSETVFYWLLTRLEGMGLIQHGRLTNPGKIVDELRRATHDILTRSQAAAGHDPEQVPRLNFLLTDGRNSFATRFNHSLFMRCSDGALGRRIEIASEPTSAVAAGWQEVAETAVLHLTV